VSNTSKCVLACHNGKTGTFGPVKPSVKPSADLYTEVVCGVKRGKLNLHNLIGVVRMDGMDVDGWARRADPETYTNVVGRIVKLLLTKYVLLNVTGA
jgi:hypothetical protein